MKITGGAYEFVLPVSFLPQYKSHEPILRGLKTDVNLVPEYTYQYGFEIISNQKVTFVGAPKGCATTQT